MVLAVTKFGPFHGSSFIPTPKYLQNKRCIVSVQNSDEKCFFVGDFVTRTGTVTGQRTRYKIRTIFRYAQRSRSELSSQSKADTPVRTTESRNQHQFIFSRSRQQESFQHRMCFSPPTSSSSRESSPTQRRHEQTLRMDTRHVTPRVAKIETRSEMPRV